MLRYFFHLYEAGDVTRDAEGREMASIEKARSAAIDDARLMMSFQVRQGSLDLSPTIDIVNLEGERVARVRFEEAVTIRDK